MRGRALLIGAAPVPGVAQLVASLGPEHEYVIAIDGGVRACIEAAIAPDVVIGDFDSATEADLRTVEAAGARLVGFPADKDVTDLDLALDEAARLGVGEVTLTGVVGSRADHTIVAMGSLSRAAAEFAVSLREPGLAGWVVFSGESLELTGAGSTVSLLALPAQAIVSVSGVRWPLVRHELQPMSSLGTSNIITASQARVEVHEGTVLVLSPAVGEYNPAGYIRRTTEKDR